MPGIAVEAAGTGPTIAPTVLTSILRSAARPEGGKGHCRRQQATACTVSGRGRQHHSGSNKQAKARHSMAGPQEWMRAACNRVAKNRRTSDLSVEKPEMVTLRPGPALE